MTDFNDHSRYDRIQKLQHINGLEDEPKTHYLATMAVGFITGLVLMAGYAGCVTSKPKNQLDCQQCHAQTAHSKMTEYFKRNGSPTPEQMATAVLMTKSPRLLAAVAKVESGGNPHIRNTGYKKRYSGAWQTGKHWGKVTNDVTHQALIAEFALESHLKDEKTIIRALNAYGGESDKKNGKYAKTVLAELMVVP